MRDAPTSAGWSPRRSRELGEHLRQRRGLVSSDVTPGLLHLAERLRVAPGATPAHSAREQPGVEAVADRVQGGRPHAVVGGEAADVDVGDLVRAQPVGESGAAVVRPSKPEYAAACSPLRKIASNGCGSRFGWNASPSVPTTQCGGHESTKSGSSLKCVARVDVVVAGRDGDGVVGRLGVLVRQWCSSSPIRWATCGAARGPAGCRPRRSRSARRPRSARASCAVELAADGQPGEDVAERSGTTSPTRARRPGSPPARRPRRPPPRRRTARCRGYRVLRAAADVHRRERVDVGRG